MSGAPLKISVFDPMSVEVGPIGPMMAAKVKDEKLKAFFESKSAEDGDGNLSGIVVGDSERMGVGVGTWEAGQHTKEPITCHFDEVLFVVHGAFQVSTDQQQFSANQGECIHIPCGSTVNFSSDQGCRLVWVTCPPTWKAFEMAMAGEEPG